MRDGSQFVQVATSTVYNCEGQAEVNDTKTTNCLLCVCVPVYVSSHDDNLIFIVGING